MTSTWRTALLSALALTTLHNVDSMYHMLVGNSAECLQAVEEGLHIARSTGVRIWSYQLLGAGEQALFDFRDVALDVDTAFAGAAEEHLDDGKDQRGIQFQYPIAIPIYRNQI